MDTFEYKSVRQAKTNPFAEAQGHLLIHCSHHRAGTLWFTNILGAVGREYGLPVIANDASKLPRGASIFIDDHSRINLSSLSQPYRGSHMVRDPRDMVVSAYHYHLWTTERWANTKLAELWPGIERYWPLLPVKDILHLTYKEYLHSLDKDTGLMAEISRVSSTDIREMMRCRPHGA